MPDNLSIVHEIKRVGTAIKDKLEIKRENKKPRVTRQKILDYHLDYDILASWLKTQFPGFDKEIDDMENVSCLPICFTETIADVVNRGIRNFT